MALCQQLFIASYYQQMTESDKKPTYIITCVCVSVLCEAIHTHTNFRFFAASGSTSTS